MQTQKSIFISVFHISVGHYSYLSTPSPINNTFVPGIHLILNATVQYTAVDLISKSHWLMLRNEGRASHGEPSCKCGSLLSFIPPLHGQACDIRNVGSYERGSIADDDQAPSLFLSLSLSLSLSLHLKTDLASDASVIQVDNLQEHMAMHN